MDKQPVPTAVVSNMININFDKIAPGKKIIIEKSDGSKEILTIADCQSNLVNNALTGQKYLMLNISFENEV